jgi:intron-binding protein aquarius
LIYHNFPSQRTLIITRSNSALNDLFLKIANLDINERYLLRLGYGEKDLEVNKDYSKNGRVNYMLARRINLLDQVNKLAKSIEILSHEEYTCESALNFYEIHIRTRINEYEKKLENVKKTELNFDLESLFPFTNFFKNNHFNNTVLFEKNSSQDDEKKSVLLLKFIDNIFLEIKDCYAFELLRNTQERGNYLLTKQAKVIAMTSTYAALKRRDFISLGLEYDNLLIEESAQLLEIETFIPLVLQKTNKEYSRLKRVILIGISLLI